MSATCLPSAGKSPRHFNQPIGPSSTLHPGATTAAINSLRAHLRQVCSLLHVARPDACAGMSGMEAGLVWRGAGRKEGPWHLRLQSGSSRVPAACSAVP